MTPDGQMEAVYIERYGSNDVLCFGRRPVPKPGPGQILIRVRAAGVNPRDWLVRDGRYPFRFLLPRFPIILGSDAAGVVAALGPGVSGFSVGDEVFAGQTATGGMGAFAEYMAVDHRAAARKPANMSFVEAAAMPLTSLTSWQALMELGRLRADQTVLVIGGSGGCGRLGVQIARLAGARVSAVCSTANLAMVAGLGADRLIDYKNEDFRESGETYDVVYDTIGKESLRSCRKVLNKKGIYVTTIPGPRTMMEAVVSRLKPGPTARVVMIRADGARLQQVSDLIEAGKIRAVIDRVYPLAGAAEALAYSRTFHTRGKLVLEID